MRATDLAGIGPSRKVFTRRDPKATSAPDLVQGVFTAPGPAVGCRPHGLTFLYRGGARGNCTAEKPLLAAAIGLYYAAVR